LQFSDELLRGRCGSCGACTDRYGRGCDDNENPKTLHRGDIAFGDAETLLRVLERRFDPIANVEDIAESPGGMMPERSDVRTGALVRRGRQLERCAQPVTIVA